MKPVDIMWMSEVRCGWPKLWPATPPPEFKQCRATFETNIQNDDDDIVLPEGWTFTDDWFRCPKHSRK